MASALLVLMLIAGAFHQSAASEGALKLSSVPEAPLMSNRKLLVQCWIKVGKC